MLDFIEPAESPFMIALIQRTWKLIAAFKRRKLRLQVSNDVRAAFKWLGNKRTIICPNHPAQEDGLVLFALSGIFKERFAYLTARECFGPTDSFFAKWLQQLGCYSVQRGTADIHAFKESCRLLTRGANKLVIFPEGEISYKNGFLRDFERGPELIALSTLQDLRNTGFEDEVFILPLTLKYKFSSDVSRHLSRVMRIVESILKIKKDPSATFEQRIRSAYERMLDIHESKKSGVSKGRKLSDRLSDFCDDRLDQLERQFSHPDSDGMDRMRRIHLLMNTLGESYCTNGNKPGASKSNKKIFAIYNSLRRLLGFMNINDHNFDHALNQEETAEILRLLVEEIDPNLSVKKPDIVMVDAAPIIDVDDYLPTTKAGRKKSVGALKQELERRIAKRLNMKVHSIEAKSSSRTAM